MASGDIVGILCAIREPDSSGAGFDTRLGGSTPKEIMVVYDFDDTATEYLDLHFRLTGDYSGGGITLTLPWSATSAIINDVRWGAAVRRINDDAEDIDSAHTYSFTDATDATTASASGETVETTLAITSGTNMDNWAANEKAVVRIRRTSATSNMAGDAELWPEFVLLKET